MGPDPFGTGTKLVWRSLVFTRDLADLLSGTNGSTYEGDPMWNRTVPVSNRYRVNRVDLSQSGSNPKGI